MHNKSMRRRDIQFEWQRQQIVVLSFRHVSSDFVVFAEKGPAFRDRLPPLALVLFPLLLDPDNWRRAVRFGLDPSRIEVLEPPFPPWKASNPVDPPTPFNHLLVVVSANARDVV